MQGLDIIHILAKGPTWFNCPEGKDVGENEEIWGLNSVYMDRQCIDRLFIMHDVRKLALAEDYNMVDNINKLNIPVYTNVAVPVLDNNILFPAGEVVDYFQMPYMMNVICWMLALAIIQKPKNISMYGADYFFGIDIDEKACTEFWLGIALGMGIKLGLPDRSALLKPPELRQPMYGFIEERAAPDGLLHQRRIRPHTMQNNTEFAHEYKLEPVK